MSVIAAIENRLAALDRRVAVETIGAALSLVFAGVFLVGGILDLRETRRVRAEGELARGTVTGRHRSGGRSTNHSLDVEFQTRAGVRVRVTESVGTRRWEATKPGDTVPLHYLPSNASVVKIGAQPELDAQGFIGSLTAVIMAGVIYRLGRRRRARPIQISEQRARVLPRGRLIVMLIAAGAAIAWAAFLIPRLPSRGRHEYLLEGQVLSIAPERKEASIKHDALHGFKPAMTTSYNVPDIRALVQLKPGDLVTATLVVVRGDVHLEDVRKAAAMPPPLLGADLDPLSGH